MAFSHRPFAKLVCGLLSNFGDNRLGFHLAAIRGFGAEWVCLTIECYWVLQLSIEKVGFVSETE